MKKMILLLIILTGIAGIVISGCATDQDGSGGYERPSGHEGHHH